MHVRELLLVDEVLLAFLSEGVASCGIPLGLTVALMGPWVPDMVLLEDVVQCVPCPLSREAMEAGTNPRTELCRC